MLKVIQEWPHCGSCLFCLANKTALNIQKKIFEISFAINRKENTREHAGCSQHPLSALFSLG